MNSRPKLSVIMSVYNGEPYVREAVASILNQTFNDYEFLIIDDGSNDGTRKILESFRDPRIRIFHQENIGLTASLNKAIGLAKGEFIARQDADDISLPERMEKLLEILEDEPEVGLVGCYVIFIDQYGNEFSRWRTPVEHEAICRESKKYNPLCHGAWVFRKSCIEEIGTYREKFPYTQDYDLLLRFASRFRVRNVDRFLYKWRKGSHTISRKRLSQQLEYHLLALKFNAEREKKGFDSYDDFTGLSPASFLRSRFQVGRNEINRFKAESFLSYSEQALKSNDHQGYAKLVGRAFLYSPTTVGWKEPLKALLGFV